MKQNLVSLVFTPAELEELKAAIARIDEHAWIPIQYPNAIFDDDEGRWISEADVAEIENVTTIESVDVSCHHSKDTWIEVGYGLPVDDPSIPAKLEKYTRVFADSVLMMADCFGLELDEVKFSAELGACTKDVDLGWYTLPKGSLGGNYIRYQGMVDGVPRVERDARRRRR